jgi:hypothetical protein
MVSPDRGKGQTNAHHQEPWSSGPGRAKHPNCFVAGTVVSTETGQRAIETIRPGERVWSYDHILREWKLCRVIDCFNNLYEGRLVGCSVAGEVIESTAHHPFWVEAGEGLDNRPRPGHVPENPIGYSGGGRWVDAIDLRIGDSLRLQTGVLVPVTELTVREAWMSVYNFHVEDLHCYTVGICQVLVHNHSESDNLPPRYETAQDAIGDYNGDFTHISTAKTKNPILRGKGFTEHQVWRDTDGNYRHTFRNPRTGEFLESGDSSHDPNYIP